MAYEYTCTGANTQLKVEACSNDGTKYDEHVWVIAVKSTPTGPSVKSYSPSNSYGGLAGSTFTTSVTIDGDASLVTFKWERLDDVTGSYYTISGATGSQYSFIPNEVGTIYLRVTATYDGNSIGQNVWTINVMGPTIKAFSPESPVVMTNGQVKTFSVELTETGYENLAYFWYLSEVDGGAWLPLVDSAGASRNIAFEYGRRQVKCEVKLGQTLCAAQIWTIKDPDAPSIERDEPSDESVRMTVGQTQVFRVKGENLEGVTYYWYTNTTEGSFVSNDRDYTFTPTSAGDYVITCDAHNSVINKSSYAFWNVTVTGGGDEGGSTDPFVRKSPEWSSSSVDVDTTLTFEAEAKVSTSGYTLNWDILKDGQIVTFTAPHSTSCPYTFRSAGTYTVTFSYSGAKSGEIVWTVTVGDGGSGGGGSGGGETPSLSRLSPTEESVSIKYGNSQTFTVEAKGLSDANLLWYVGDFQVGGNVTSYSYRPDDPGTTTLTCKAISKTGNTVLASISWTVTAYEEGGSGGGGTTALFEKDSPAAQNQAMTAGDKMTFSVKANGDTSDYVFFWDFSIDGDPAAAG